MRQIAAASGAAAGRSVSAAVTRSGRRRRLYITFGFCIMRAVFDSRFFEEAWPLISRGLESEVDAEAEIAWILGHVGPPAAGRVLAAPCGFGRHSVVLARRGFDVTGVDLSETELRRAKERAAAADVALQLVRQDMRDMDFSGEFDLALNLFSSIGFFTDDEDRLLIDRFCPALKPGGAFVLDTRTRDAVLHDLTAEQTCSAEEPHR